MTTIYAFADLSGNDNDTLYITGKAVVFFGPSQAEYMSMTHEQKDAIDEDLYDFYHYRGKVQKYLELNEIQDFDTARSKIQIQLAGDDRITYHRKSLDHIVGIIMTDPQQQPKVILGVYKNSELISVFEEYFGLE
jgi:hypothetical protein